MNNDEVRTFEVVGPKWALGRLKKHLGLIQYLGDVGASQTVELWVDGDGAGRLQVYVDGRRAALVKREGVMVAEFVEERGGPGAINQACKWVERQIERAG